MNRRATTPLWRDIRFWRIASQILFLAGLALLIWFFVRNARLNMAKSGLRTGFDFLHDPASFAIGETLIRYDPSQTYLRAFLVGLTNTLLVALLGIGLATPLGTLIGLARLSSNWLVHRLAALYVAVIRNTPLLVQLTVWYFGLFLHLPPVREQIVWPGPIYLNNRGVTLPWFGGQAQLTPEFAALLVGLVVYTAAFIGEIVRAGVQSVSKGQREAARALGLRPGQVLRLVIFPQALRVIIPPLTNQYLNLTKNSSLAVYIAYPDLFNISTTIFNQTGRSVEVFLIVMAIYLTFSLLTSLVMNLYNRSVRLVER